MLRSLIVVWREGLSKKKKQEIKKENRLNLDSHLSFVEGIPHRQCVNLTARLHSGCNLGQQIKQVEHQACLNHRKLSAVWQISFDKSVYTPLVYLSLVAFALKINKAGQELVKRTENSLNSAKFYPQGPVCVRLKTWLVLHFEPTKSSFLSEYVLFIQIYVNTCSTAHCLSSQYRILYFCRINWQSISIISLLLCTFGLWPIQIDSITE